MGALCGYCCESLRNGCRRGYARLCARFWSDVICLFDWIADWTGILLVTASGWRKADVPRRTGYAFGRCGDLRNYRDYQHSAADNGGCDGRCCGKYTCDGCNTAGIYGPYGVRGQFYPDGICHCLSVWCGGCDYRLFDTQTAAQGGSEGRK